MSDYRKNVIKHEADKIREQIKGGRLFGEFVNENDQDAMLYAAYLIGSTSESDSYLLHGDPSAPEPVGILSGKHLQE